MDNQQPNVTFSENTDDAIHSAVRDYYTAIATNSKASCCGESSADCCGDRTALYDAELLADAILDVSAGR